MTLRRLLWMPLLLACFCWTEFAHAQWTTYAPMPATRWAHVCAPATGRMYVLAGSTGPTWEFNPVTNTWQTLASIPTQRSYPGVASWNGRIYVLGGSQGAAWSTKNECFDPATNTWTTLADMPQARTTTAAAAVNGKVYVLNGWNGTAMTAVDIYDIATNTWTAGAPAPTGRSHAKTAIVNNRIYLVGGYDGSWVNRNEVYDPASNSWQTMAPMPTSRYIHAVGAIGTRIFVAGGYAGSASNVFESYDTGTNAWSPEPAMPTARYRTDGAAVNGCFYVMGGYNGVNLNTNEGFCGVILPQNLELHPGSGPEVPSLWWEDPVPQSADLYRIERAAAGSGFEIQAELSATFEGERAWLWTDPSPLSGYSLYRVGRLDHSGSIFYSNVISFRPSQATELEIGWDPKTQELVFRGGGEENTEVEVFDLQGTLLVRTILPGTREQPTCRIPMAPGASQMCFVRTSQAGKYQSRKMYLSRP